MSTSAQTDELPLFAPTRKVYPQSVKGPFRRAKWAILIVCLTLYYCVPFLRWNRGPNLPDQAVLADIAHNRFYFFFIELWPQEVYYFTGLMVIGAFTLFLMNAVAGRVWCGYLCPQTVWTDLFLAVERFFEGDRRSRIKRDEAALTFDGVLRKIAKHSIWIVIAWWTGGAWVLYFADAPTLVYQLATFTAPATAYVWIGILTFTTYALAGIMREQVCTYMCPWPRIQAALTDNEALNVTYRIDRGEPRASMKDGARLRAAGENAGDCIDCMQCVFACPTGVDIRAGSQLGCIQCGLCIDACNHVMLKIGRPLGLIAYDTDENVERRLSGQTPRYRPVRARTLIYFALIALVAIAIAYQLTTRKSVAVSVMHERSPLAVTLSDGSIRNAYLVRILNMSAEARVFDLSTSGIEGASVEVVGGAKDDTLPNVTIEADTSEDFRVLITAPSGARLLHSQEVVIHIKERRAGENISATDHFFSP